VSDDLSPELRAAVERDSYTRTMREVLMPWAQRVQRAEANLILKHALNEARREAEAVRDYYATGDVLPFSWEREPAAGAGPQPEEVNGMDAYYNWIPSRGAPTHSFDTRADAVLEAQRLADKEKCQVTVLRVEDRIAPSGPAVAPPSVAAPAEWTVAEFDALAAKVKALRDLALALADYAIDGTWYTNHGRISDLAEKVRGR